jgi:hypothetical protein
MKEFIKNLIVYVLITFFIFSQLPSFALPVINIYFWATLIILALTMMMVAPLLNFLTIKCKFPTFLLMSTILLSGVTYVLNLFMTDFYVNESTFEGIALGSLEINSFVITPIVAIILFAFLASFVTGIYREVDKA